VKFLTLAIRRIFMIGEILAELRAINAKLDRLDKCIKIGVKHKPNTSHIVTAHWND